MMPDLLPKEPAFIGSHCSVFAMPTNSGPPEAGVFGPCAMPTGAGLVIARLARLLFRACGASPSSAHPLVSQLTMAAPSTIIIGQPREQASIRAFTP